MTATDQQIRDAIAEQATEWFISNQSGPPDAQQRAAFMSWLRSSPIHVAEYLAIAGVARDLPAAAIGFDLASLAPLDRQSNPLPAPLPAASRRPLLQRAAQWWREAAYVPRAVAVGALSVVAALAAVYWQSGDWASGPPQLYSTAHGEQQLWQLMDGSTLRLNTDSAVQVRYSRSERLVTLMRGQGHFEVAREPERRFRVAAGGVDIVAVGTRFDVRRQDERVLATVFEGKVAIGDSQVNAGQQLELLSGIAMAPPSLADLRAAAAWQNGQIIFERRMLGEITDEFSRYSPLPIEIVDPTVRAMLISGVFNTDDTDSFLAFIDATDGLQVQRTPGAPYRVVRKAP